MADFNTSDCRIAWDKFDSPWDKIQWLQHAKVEIKTLADAVLRTEYTKESFFLYTKAMNDEDSAGTSFKVTITLIDIFDIPSPEATLTCTNPAPSQPVGMSATSTSTGILVATTSTLPDDLDVVEVYRHTADVFGSATKIAEIKTQSFNDENVILGDTYYYWYKIRDVYGNLSTVSASANNSSSLSGTEILNTSQEWDDVLDGGGTRPEDNSTVGAPNGTNVGSTEASVVEGDSAKAGLGLNASGEVKLVIKGPNLPTTGMVDGLNVTQDYLGYYDLAGLSWDAYISSDGTFKFRGDDDNEIFWNGSTLVIRGSLNADDISSGHIVGRNITTSGSYLTSAALVSATIISLNSTGIFPASGNAFIGNTQISYTGKTATTLTGCTNVPASGQDTPVTLDESGITIDTINDRIILYGNDGTDITSLINFGLDTFDGETYLGYFGTVDSLRGGIYFLNDASVPLIHIDSSGSGFTPGLAAIHVDIDDGTGTGLSIITGLTATSAPAISIVSNGTSADELGMLIDILDGSDGKAAHLKSSGWALYGETDSTSNLRAAVYGKASDVADGIRGESDSGIGVKAISSSGVAVNATSSSGNAIEATSDASSGTTKYDLNCSGSGLIFMNPFSSVRKLPSIANGLSGMFAILDRVSDVQPVYFDNNANIWRYVVDNSTVSGTYIAA